MPSLKLGYRDKDGYVIIRRNRRPIKLHRWVVEQVEHRILNSDDIVRHTCDNPPCFLYEHLRVGTVRDNVADMNQKARRHVRRGEEHHSARLSITEIETIRGLYAAGGVLQRELAEYFNVHAGHISNVVRGARWRPR